MKKKFLTSLLALMMLSSMALTGCSDEEYDDYAEDTSVSDEAVNSDETAKAENNTDGNFDPSKLSIAPAEDVQLQEDSDNVVRGGDMVEIKGEQEMDENPNRAVRRNIKPVKFTPGRMLDGTPLTEEYYLHRQALNDSTLQKAYDELRNGLLAGEAEVYLSVPISKGDIGALFTAVIFDEPELFYVEPNYVIYSNNYGVVTKLAPKYNDLVYDIEGNRKKIEQAASKALANMWALDYDIEKIKYAHDYLTNTCVYKLGSPYNQTMYSAVVNHVTVCAGFSRAFNYFMHKMGIPCTSVYGDAGGAHSWNLVKGGNDYYAMDVTWDNDDRGSNIYKYDYFCITDQQIMQKKHQRKSVSTLLPVANGTAYSYQNAFGGNYPGTDFDAIQGELPQDNSDDYDAPQDDSSQPQGDDNWWEEEKDNNQMDNGNGEGWWNLLDPSWTKDNWYESEVLEGYMETYDEASHWFYLWEKGTNNFYALTENGEELFVLDMNSYEWVECED